MYTDGSCLGNPGPGGWSVVVEGGKSYSGSLPHTTNNIAELTAFKQALLLALHSEEIHVIHSDSSYVVNGYNVWLNSWRLSNFKNRTVKNLDLWLEIDELKRQVGSKVNVVWVKAHNGDILNEEADVLAKSASLNN